MISGSSDYVDLSDFHFQDGTEPTNYVRAILSWLNDRKIEIFVLWNEIWNYSGSYLSLPADFSILVSAEKSEFVDQFLCSLVCAL